MKSRYQRFVAMFPEISTLSALKRVMDTTEPLAFCETYLKIHANSAAADKNPKYCLLKALTDGFLEYQKLHGLSSEIEAIRQWSGRVKLDDLENDFIGKRLNLGDRVMKPDRHVIGVMEQCLQMKIPLDRYSEFAHLIGKNPRYLDCILFEYGKAKKISA